MRLAVLPPFALMPLLLQALMTSLLPVSKRLTACVPCLVQTLCARQCMVLAAMTAQ
jgi:hypothetical protein